MAFPYSIRATALPGFTLDGRPREAHTTLAKGKQRHLVTVLENDGYRRKGDVQIVDAK